MFTSNSTDLRFERVIKEWDFEIVELNGGVHPWRMREGRTKEGDNGSRLV